MARAPSANWVSRQTRYQQLSNAPCAGTKPMVTSPKAALGVWPAPPPKVLEWPVFRPVLLNLESMRILVTFAVEAEFAPWRKRRAFDRENAEGPKLWRSVIGDSEIVVTLTGIGDKSANVLDLMMRVADCKRYFDVCVSSGLAGALRSDYQPSD